MGEKMTLEQVRDYLRFRSRYVVRERHPEHTMLRCVEALDAHLTQPAQAVERVVDLHPEDSRCPPTYRREEAVKTLIGMGWSWDGKQWCSSKAESPLSKLHRTLLLRAKALRESGDEWMEDMGEHYKGIAEELAAAMILALPNANGKEG